MQIIFYWRVDSKVWKKRADKDLESKAGKLFERCRQEVLYRCHIKRTGRFLSKLFLLLGCIHLSAQSFFIRTIPLTGMAPFQKTVFWPELRTSSHLPCPHALIWSQQGQAFGPRPGWWWRRYMECPDLKPTLYSSFWPVMEVDQVKIHFSCQSSKVSVPGEGTNSQPSSKYLRVTKETAETLPLAAGTVRANTQLLRSPF